MFHSTRTLKTLLGSLATPKFHGDALQPASRFYSSRIIFVGGMSSSAAKTDLVEAFKRYGVIKTVRLALHPKTEHCKGFGFIEFQSAEAARKAIQDMNGTTINGRTIKVAYATPQGQKD